MIALKGIETTVTSSFGSTKTSKTVTVSILDKNKNVVSSNVTIGTVVELSDGSYGVTLTFASGFTSNFCGYVRFTNTTDGTINYESLMVVSDYISDITSIRKIETNRWKINAGQLVIYDDDGTTPLYTFNLYKASVVNGDEPDERVRA